jgi:hypothetical protein
MIYVSSVTFCSRLSNDNLTAIYIDTDTRKKPPERGCMCLVLRRERRHCLNHSKQATLTTELFFFYDDERENERRVASCRRK